MANAMQYGRHASRQTQPIRKLSHSSSPLWSLYIICTLTPFHFFQSLVPFEHQLRSLPSSSLLIFFFICDLFFSTLPALPLIARARFFSSSFAPLSLKIHVFFALFYALVNILDANNALKVYSWHNKEMYSTSNAWNIMQTNICTSLMM